VITKQVTIFKIAIFSLKKYFYDQKYYIFIGLLTLTLITNWYKK